MANIKANAKSAERAKNARIKHKAEKSFLKNRIRDAKTTGSADKVSAAYKAFDSKVSKGLIKKSTANRLKSRLAIHVNKLNSPKTA